MPDPETLKRAEEDKREGKSASTQAGEFVREEMHHIREGKHGAASAKQAIAIGLSKARRAGVDLPPPDADTQSEAVREHASRDRAKGRQPHRPSRRLPRRWRVRRVKPRANDRRRPGRAPRRRPPGHERIGAADDGYFPPASLNAAPIEGCTT